MFVCTAARYFTSRPALKRYVRFISPYLQVVRHWEVFVGSNGSVSQPLWEAQGVAQHHDAVAGTAKQAVTYDYAQRLSEGYASADAWLGATMGEVLSTSGTAPTFASCPLSNQSICAVSQSTNQLVVVLYNPTARNRTERISVPWRGKEGVKVQDGAGSTVASQLQPAMPNLARTANSAPSEVHFLASVPGIGIATYFITQQTAEATSQAPQLATVHADARHHHARKPLSVLTDPTISNEYWTLTFDGSTGLLSSAKDLKAGTTTPISQNFLWYKAYQGGGQDSGFDNTATPHTRDAATVVRSAMPDVHSTGTAASSSPLLHPPCVCVW